MPIGAFRATCAPTPMTLRVTPPSDIVSYATCTPNMPKPRLAPNVTPTLESVLPETAVHRLVTVTYGSMLTPGVGRPALTPAPATMCVAAGIVDSPVPDSALRPAPTTRLIATGIRLP